MTKFYLVRGLLFFLGLYSLAAQEQETTGSPDVSALSRGSGDGFALSQIPNVQLALSTPNYPVTAGDIYMLTYLAGTQAVEYTIPVDTGYRIRVSNLAVINAVGKTYTELKTQVESVVTTNYPMSGVQFVLKTPAVFTVRVTGEVKTAGEVSAWALTRLSSLLDDENLTSFASLRDVSITSTNGRVHSFDLFKAQRSGDPAQDPYLRPGDLVTFNRVQRAVTINGEVERPGRYHLLEGENIKELIEYYGSGFTPLADTSRLELVRYVDSDSVSGDKVFLGEGDIDGNYGLRNYDTVTVSRITNLRPVIFVEGAIGVEEGADLTTSTRLTVSFEKGEYYAALIRGNREWFSAVSDTRNAYVIRGENRIPMNLNPMLYDASFRGEMLVEENDTLIIPFRQYFVTVAGAVVNPGRYPYIPDRSWDYYVGLAGGFVSDRNAFQKVDISDINGKTLRKTDIITPESIITASTNNGLYYFNQVAPVVTTTLSLVLSFISIWQLTTR
jgi:protein involved in polysaccharide export with SLBB domain